VNNENQHAFAKNGEILQICGDSLCVFEVENPKEFEFSFSEIYQK